MNDFLKIDVIRVVFPFIWYGKVAVRICDNKSLFAEAKCEIIENLGLVRMVILKMYNFPIILITRKLL